MRVNPQEDKSKRQAGRHLRLIIIDLSLVPSCPYSWLNLKLSESVISPLKIMMIVISDYYEYLIKQKEVPYCRGNLEETTSTCKLNAECLVV